MSNKSVSCMYHILPYHKVLITEPPADLFMQFTKREGYAWLLRIHTLVPLIHERPAMHNST